MIETIIVAVTCLLALGFIVWLGFRIRREDRNENLSNITLVSTIGIREGDYIDVLGEEFIVVKKPNPTTITVIPRGLIGG